MKIQPLTMGLCILFMIGSSTAFNLSPARSTHFINGLWFNGTTFFQNDFYAVGSLLTRCKPLGKVAVTVDLHGGLQATACIYIDDKTPSADVTALKTRQIGNLRGLKTAGASIVVGSDTYAQDAVHEADYLQSFGLWSNLEMLRMWSVTTPKDIFPKRRIDALEEDYEANLLVLSSDPLTNWSAVHGIVDRWKMGQHVVLSVPKK